MPASGIINGEPMRRSGIGKRKCRQVRSPGQADRYALRRLRKHWLLCRLHLFLAKYVLAGPAFKKEHHLIASLLDMDQTKKPMTLWRNMFSRQAAKFIAGLSSWSSLLTPCAALAPCSLGVLLCCFYLIFFLLGRFL